MTLHRDIYWLGRQWAVTGHGIQAVNKKLDMRFDVAASRIWEEDTDQPMRELDWFDAEDFAERCASQDGCRRRLRPSFSLSPAAKNNATRSGQM